MLCCSFFCSVCCLVCFACGLQFYEKRRSNAFECKPPPEKHLSRCEGSRRDAFSSPWIFQMHSVARRSLTGTTILITQMASQRQRQRAWLAVETDGTKSKFWLSSSNANTDSLAKFSSGPNGIVGEGKNGETRTEPRIASPQSRCLRIVGIV